MKKKKKGGREGGLRKFLPHSPVFLHGGAFAERLGGMYTEHFEDTHEGLVPAPFVPCCLCKLGTSYLLSFGLF